MSIISYAQNFEDVILWRALKHVKSGFYIDVGANHPKIDSVTKLFYDNGWRGINIEPEFELFYLLEQDRKLDVNLNIAVSRDCKDIKFYVSNVRGWASTDVGQLENLKKTDSFLGCRIVSAMSLDEICDENQVENVHFLKIDVEGAEKDVLESFTFTKVRPWIIVVEATKPTTQIDVSYKWEHIIVNRLYHFVYFDGVNRYYIANEHDELDCHFSSPPNVFDDFILASQMDAESRAIEAEARAVESESRAIEAEARAVESESRAIEAEARAVESESRAIEAEAKVTEVEQEIYNIKRSSTWRLFGPYRYFRRAISLIFSDISVSEKSSHVKRSIIFRIKRNNFLYSRIKFLFVKFPSLHSFYMRNLKNNFTDSSCGSFVSLTKKEQDVYIDLLVEIRKGRL